MFIKYDETELFDFFECEPDCIGGYEVGEFMYVYKENDFKLIVLLSTYEMYVDISITYKNNDVYSQTFKNVTEISKIDNKSMKIILSDESRIILKRHKQIGVIVE